MLSKTESPRDNLKLLWWLRSIAIVGQSVTVGVACDTLGLTLPLAPLFAIIVALALINLITWLRLRSAKPVGEAEFFAQLVIDMLGLAALLYLTGGASNPFTSLFILQVVIAAIALSPLYCWLSACIAIALYTVLMFCRRDLPMLSHQHGDGFGLHVQGMWVNFMLLALLVAWFVARMARTLRRQDMLLAQAEQFAALGTQATQAAHDLGTPLATMAVLAGEYRDDAQDDAQRKRAATLGEQIRRCKESISQIAAAAGVMRAESGRPVALDAFLTTLAERFREARQQIWLDIELKGSQPVPVIAPGVGLERAIANLLANAADASPEGVRLEAQWSAQSLTLCVIDRGPGMPDVIRNALGEPVASTKPEGLGMGLFLTRTVLMRLGGTLAAEAPPNGGTCMRVTLPLAGLRP